MITSLRFYGARFTELSALYDYAQGPDGPPSYQDCTLDDIDVINAIHICSDGVVVHFDGELFTSLDSLSNYIAGEYGSWTQVPDNHPDIAIVKALCGHNPKYSIVHNSIVYTQSC